MEQPLKFDDISNFCFKFGILGLFVILMSNTVKKLNNVARIQCGFFSWSVEIYMHVVNCMRAKKYHVTEIFTCIIFHNYVLWSAHFHCFYACLFVWWCLKCQFQQYFSYMVAVPFFFFWIDFFAIKRKRGRFF